jgi:hypothetical protein
VLHRAQISGVNDERSTALAPADLAAGTVEQGIDHRDVDGGAMLMRTTLGSAI